MMSKKCDECLIWKRVLVTAAVLVLVRILYFIPLLGVNLSAVIEFYKQHIKLQGGGLMDLMALLHIGKLRNISLSSLGIMPFVNACIILQIISFLIPGLNRKFFHEEGGRSRLLYATVIIALILSAFYGYQVSMDLELMNKFPDINLLKFTGLLFQITTILSLCTISLIYIMLTQLINKSGFGNGVGVIFSVEVIIRFIFAADQLLVFWGRNLIGIKHLVVFSGVVIAFVYFARKITRIVNRVELCTDNNEHFHISIRPVWMGVWPLIITEIVFSYFEVSFDISSFFLVLITIIFFTLVYAKIIYKPRRFYELILAHNCKIKETKSKKIIDYLNASITKTIALSAVLFVAIYYLPVILPLLLKISFMSAGIFGTFGLIILVGVYHDIKRQLKFFRKIRSLPLKQWSLLDIASDETEAEIKKACLRSRSIMNEIKPSHFSWGLPIRTIASGFYLYVPLEDKIKAEQVLEQTQKEWRNKAL
ncbi:MAG: preprotein translocase subunit SecY [Candidatus Omnitrophica bacterium]|nr:preprotein translocase subunit SecY [Candidatus Omnitrophota bacterium]